MQNLPTMTSILQEELEETIRNRSNTRAKELERKIQKLKDPENILTVVGVLQLLEIYAATSLEGQHSNHFPTQVWNKVKEAKETVEKLSERWEWSEKDMKYSVMEAPQVILKRMQEEGRYEPKLKMENLVKVKQDMRDSGLLDEDQQLSDLFHEKQQVKPLAGEVILEKITSEELVTKVEAKLEKFAKSIDKEWKKRQVQTPLEKAASAVLSSEVFQENLEVDEGTDGSEGEHVVEDEGWGTEKKKRFKLLKSLIDALPAHQAERFQAIEIFPGLESYLRYFKETLEVEEKMGEDKVYKCWYRMYILCEDPLECNISFVRLFQNIQIRTSLEAVAEMVGSIMKNHVGKNRHLKPDSFSKEIVLTVNLGPQHLLEGLVEEVCQVRKKEYLFKRNGKGRLATQASRLADPVHGASIRTFRKLEKQKSRFPVNFWS